MPRYYVEYRGEFGAEVKAKNMAEAMSKFAGGNCLMEIIGDLDCQHFQISELHRMGKKREEPMGNRMRRKLW